MSTLTIKRAFIPFQPKQIKQTQLFFIFITNMQNEEKLRTEFTAAGIKTERRGAHDTLVHSA
jgi:hypothetical protein